MKQDFEKGQLVHVISRAVVDIFKKEEDCYRFIFQFYASNIGKRVTNVRTEDAMKAGKALLWGEKIPSKFVVKEHPPLVDLLDFSLVINHNHFYLLLNFKNALPILMKKLNDGFAKYFNLTHNRKDAVFGSRHKAIAVTTDFQSDAVSRYICIINPLDVFQPGWREKGLKNWKKGFEFLKNYEFSSFPDRIGIRKAGILAPGEISNRYTFQISSPKEMNEFQKFVEEFLKERSKSPLHFYLE